ncbi:nucleotide-diphospho-sugar transferase [Hymenopellis radicata]|nr:nucleotide-diphospho-sugar transferase [Hymenopellis radicata]
MAVPYAFVTLLTSDYYLPGALALAAALRDIHPSPAQEPEVDFQTVCLVTPETVDVSTIKLLRRAFNVVVGVETIVQEDDKGLQLLGRPDLYTVLTKLHVFRLTQYSKVIFLDADVLPIRPLSHLFTLPHEFSAVPDVGWPDIFNSGVMVLSPGQDKFEQVSAVLQSRGSWDGGDQGVLNEWRGGDWNRLSFTYNTTPTAAYTYAPAYERFGSDIKAIHFIGPNKPWNAIVYRTPFSGRQNAPTEEKGRAYDYDSLLDRWFAVYDKHYRAESIISESEFEVRRYVSAWDEQTGTGAEFAASADLDGPGAALGLEVLRRLALEGTSSSGITSDNRSGEGEYKSLPLEGRFDLMRPPPQPEQPPPTQDSSINPPSGVSSVPSPACITACPNACRNLSFISLHRNPVDLRGHHHHHQSQGQQTPTIQGSVQHQHHEPPRRPASPPKLSWNPALEPPPKNVPTPSTFPTDTYFPNVWDQAPSRRHDQPYQFQQNRPVSPTSESGAFFRPPPVPQIPKQLRKQGHYRNVIGDDNSDSPLSPDRGKVKPIFPWEEQPRPRPGRVFPSYDAPSPSEFRTSEPPKIAPASSPSPPSSQPLSPLQGLPISLTYANAWDSVPSIQKYANRLVRPPQPPPLAPAFDSNEWKRRGGRSWDERAEASSRDGDDEDEGDEEEGTHKPGLWADDSDNETTTVKSRSRGSSTSSSYAIKGKRQEYRVRGVQTISPVMRSQGVQVSLGTQPSETPRSLRPTSLPPATINQVSGGPDVSMTTAFPSPVGGVRSPREFTFPDTPTARPAVSVITPPSKQLTDSPSITRQSSTEGSSPPSSVGPLSPPDQPLQMGSPMRKAGRVFDPARGVEVFKRGSEEVLARFLKMSSWEEDAASH